MAHRDEILDHANTLLDAGGFADYCPNGLQVVGADEVTRIASGVSASAELFDRAIEQGAQLVLVHHGLFWKNTPQVVGRTMRGRLTRLLAHDITLAGYHLPLDAHPTLGNNAIIARELGVRPTGEPFALFGGRPIGVVGELEAPGTLEAFVADVSRLTGREALCVGAKLDAVRRVAICSGGGAGELAEAATLGADVLVTGEAAEPSMAEARELGVALIAGGHWATEVFGVRALGEHLAEHFGLEHTFHAIANPV